MARAQGALEYLIIIAALLAISAVVVMFLTNAFTSGSSGAYLATCKAAATRCYNGLHTGIYIIDLSAEVSMPASSGLTAYLMGGIGPDVSSGCVPFCVDACRDANGYDFILPEVLVTKETCSTARTPAWACRFCAAGQAECVAVPRPDWC